MYYKQTANYNSGDKTETTKPLEAWNKSQSIV